MLFCLYFFVLLDFCVVVSADIIKLGCSANNCLFGLLDRKLLTICIEECRLETFSQGRIDAGDGDSADSALSRLDRHAVASHKSAIALWLSVFKVNNKAVELLMLSHHSNN